jgi:flagellar basal-body rod protein FlgG
MIRALYTAASGMNAQQTNIDNTAHNLANVNTTGFKKARVEFEDLVYQQVRGAGAPNSASTEVPIGLEIGLGTRAVGTARDFATGNLKTTNAPLDVAIQGQGFFRVRRADGTEALTRDGSLRLDANRRLTTQHGEPLQPAVRVPDGVAASDVQIAADGTLGAKGQTVGRIRVVNVRSPEALQPLGDSLFRATAASGAAQTLATARLTPGALEASNVDVADAMTAMMDAQRTFQLTSRAIQMQDQMLQIANGVKGG